MSELLSISLALSAAIATTCFLAKGPDGPPPSWWPRDRLVVVTKVITVYACPPKDEARLPQGFMPPKFVKTESITAANYPPVVQTKEHRKRKR